MGRDKALLPWQGATLLDHALARLHEACPTVRVLSGTERRYEDRGTAVDLDAVPDSGPLGAIYTGLLHVGHGVGLFLAVDLPFVTTALLRRLIELAAEGHDAVVPISSDGPQPLCAVYGPTCLDPIRRRLDKADLKATSFWPEVRVLRADESQLGAFGPLDVLFRNVNTPDDYERARGDAG